MQEIGYLRLACKYFEVPVVIISKEVLTMTKNNFYAVARGTKPGIYNSWYGENGAEVQIKGFPNALHKGFKTRTEAEEWYFKNRDISSSSSKNKGAKRFKTKPVTQVKSESKIVRSINSDNQTEALSKVRKIVIYTDGGCSNNPGQGGYGVVFVRGDTRKEYSGGFRKTTNNRMELMACIVALQALRSRHSATIYSDSKYVVDSIEKGWAEKWKANDWMRTRTEKAKNADLWSELLELCDKHKVKFKWVKGHAGNPENERCDNLAMRAMSKKGLPPDRNYEAGKTQVVLKKL